MFSNNEVAEIVRVKTLIENHLRKMFTQPWAEPYTLPWDTMYLTGGAIASLLQFDTPKDWDFYCDTDIHMHNMKTHLELQTQHVQDVDESYKETIGINGKMITANAITMTDTSSFITMFTGSPAEIKKTFDYLHCTPHFSVRERKLYISPAQYHACKSKKLVVNNENTVTAKRRDKFKKRGYT